MKEIIQTKERCRLTWPDFQTSLAQELDQTAGEQEARIYELTAEVEQLNEQLTEQQQQLDQLQRDKTVLQSELAQRDEDLTQVGPGCLGAYRGFPTRMVYLYYKSCLRYTILVGNPQYFCGKGERFLSWLSLFHRRGEDSPELSMLLYFLWQHILR